MKHTSRHVTPTQGTPTGGSIGCHGQPKETSAFGKRHRDLCPRPVLISSKGAAGHDNVTFEGGFVIFVCQVPWTPGKVPSTPAVLRCPSARWIAPFSAGVAPFSPNRTPICEWLRLLPKALRPLPMVCVLFPGISKGYAAPRPYRGSGAALRCMSAPHVGVTSTFFFLHA